MKLRIWDEKNKVLIYSDDENARFIFDKDGWNVKYLTEYTTVENGETIFKSEWEQVDGYVTEFLRINNIKGIDIFEGDYVKDAYGNIWEIYWDFIHFRFYLRKIDVPFKEIDYGELYGMEVVDNIYERNLLR